MQSLIEKIESNAAARLPLPPGRAPAQELARYKAFLKVETHRLKLLHRSGGGGREVCHGRAAILDLETGLFAQEFGRDWFGNGAIPSGIVKASGPVNEANSKVVKSRFTEAASGREVVVLGDGLDYQPITVPPEESQFLATMKATAGQVAAIYGVPPEMIGGETGASMTYQNVEQQQINFVTHSLRPYLLKLESALTTLLPRPQYLKYSVDALVRADMAARYAAHHLALTDGWKSKDEVRALEDLPPLPDRQGAGYAPLPGPGKTPTEVPK